MPDSDGGRYVGCVLSASVSIAIKSRLKPIQGKAPYMAEIRVYSALPFQTANLPVYLFLIP